MLVLHILFNLLLVTWCEMDLMGLVGAALLTRLVILFLLLLYCWCVRDRLAWAGYHPDVCRNWGETFKLGISGKCRTEMVQMIC